MSDLFEVVILGNFVLLYVDDCKILRVINCLVDYFFFLDLVEIVFIDVFNRFEIRKGFVVGILLILLKVCI